MTENDNTPQALMNKLIAGFEPLFEGGCFPIAFNLRFQGIGAVVFTYLGHNVVEVHTRMHVDSDKIPALLWTLRILHYEMDNYSEHGDLAFCLSGKAQAQLREMGYRVE